MGTATDEIYVKIIADVQGAVAGMMQLAEKVIGAYVSFNTLKTILVDSFNAYKEEEVSIIRLNEALKISGQYTSQASADLETLAKQMQRTTVYADDTARSAEGILMQLGNLSVYGVQKLMPLIADFASSMGIDLVQAAELVGKSMGGTTNMLGRYGIELTGLKDPQERFNKLVEEMDKKFGGMAQTLASTTDGQLKQLKNNLDDLSESLGGIIAQLLNPVLTGINTTFKIGSIMQVDPKTINDLATVQSMLNTMSIYLSQQGGRATQHITAQEIQKMNDQFNQLLVRQVQLQDAIDKAPKSAFNDAEEARKLAEQLQADAKALQDMADAVDNPAWKAYQQSLLEGPAKQQRDPFSIPGEGTMNQRPPGGWGTPGNAEQIAQGLKIIQQQSEAAAPDVAALAKQAGELAKQMQTVADAAVQFGTALAKGDVQGAFSTLGMQVAKLLVQYALTAAAAAAVKQDWATMAFWLGIAGVGVAGEIAIGASGSSQFQAPQASSSSGRSVTVNVQGSVIAERDIARTMVSAMRDW